MLQCVLRFKKRKKEKPKKHSLAAGKLVCLRPRFCMQCSVGSNFVPKTPPLNEFSIDDHHLWWVPRETRLRTGNNPFLQNKPSSKNTTLKLRSLMSCIGIILWKIFKQLNVTGLFTKKKEKQNAHC